MQESGGKIVKILQLSTGRDSKRYILITEKIKEFEIDEHRNETCVVITYSDGTKERINSLENAKVI